MAWLYKAVVLNYRLFHRTCVRASAVDNALGQSIVNAGQSRAFQARLCPFLKEF